MTYVQQKYVRMKKCAHISTRNVEHCFSIGWLIRYCTVWHACIVLVWIQLLTERFCAGLPPGVLLLRSSPNTLLKKIKLCEKNMVIIGDYQTHFAYKISWPILSFIIGVLSPYIFIGHNSLIIVHNSLMSPIITGNVTYNFWLGIYSN